METLLPIAKSINCIITCDKCVALQRKQSETPILGVNQEKEKECPKDFYNDIYCNFINNNPKTETHPLS